MSAPFRVGSGYDVHRLKAGRKCILGGVEIPSEIGPDGHSDADVLLHAITDAVLGAIGEGDIGAHFPPSDPKWKGAPSDTFLRHAMQLARTAGYELGNIDATVIAEAPKLRAHIEKIRESIAAMCGVASGEVSVKATTHEEIGTLGRGEGIASLATVLLYKP